MVAVDSLPPEGRTVALSLPPEEVERQLREVGLADVRPLEPVTGEFRVLRTGEDVFVVGSLRGRVEYTCRRCLEPFSETVEGEVHVTLSREEEPAGPEVELHREDLELEVLREGAVDLTALLLEHLQLSLRDHPVCREECRGLCQGCGAALDREPCRCEAPNVDPRLSVLASWGPKR